MKKVAVLMLCLAASGCSGLEKHIEDTSWFFGGDPNMPQSESENFRRVRGEAVVESPLMTQKEDVWPGQPDAVPTIQDVSNPNSYFSNMFRNSLRGLNDDLDQQMLANGESLSMGEDVATRHGIQRRSSAIGPGLPSHVADQAPQYLEGPNRETVAIPNGDGTTTLVAPDGSVRVVRGDPSSVMQNKPIVSHHSARMTLPERSTRHTAVVHRAHRASHHDELPSQTTTSAHISTPSAIEEHPAPVQQHEAAPPSHDSVPPVPSTQDIEHLETQSPPSHVAPAPAVPAAPAPAPAPAAPASASVGVVKHREGGQQHVHKRRSRHHKRHWGHDPNYYKYHQMPNVR